MFYVFERTKKRHGIGSLIKGSRGREVWDVSISLGVISIRYDGYSVLVEIPQKRVHKEKRR